MKTVEGFSVTFDDIKYVSWLADLKCGLELIKIELIHINMNLIGHIKCLWFLEWT